MDTWATSLRQKEWAFGPGGQPPDGESDVADTQHPGLHATKGKRKIAGVEQQPGRAAKPKSIKQFEGSHPRSPLQETVSNALPERLALAKSKSIKTRPESGARERPQLDGSGAKNREKSVADTGHTEPQGRDETKSLKQRGKKQPQHEPPPRGGQTGGIVTNTKKRRSQGIAKTASGKKSKGKGLRPQLTGSGGRNHADSGGGWPIEPPVGRVANGIPDRVDRLKALGNSLVPQVVEQLGLAIIKASQ